MRAKVAEIKYVKDPEPMIVAISREHLPLPNRGRWRTSHRRRIVAKGTKAQKLGRAISGLVRILVALGLIGLAKSLGDSDATSLSDS